MSVTDAARLRRLRKNLGLSQRDLAREFKVSPGAIGFWESGGRVIPGPILKLVEAFEHHLSPLGAPGHGLTEAQLGKLCEEWTDKLLTSIPHQKSSSMRTALRRLLHRYLTVHLSRDPIRRSVQIATYSRLAGQFDRTRGLPLKIIQLASYLDPDLPVELRECLSFLQGAITGMPAGVAARIIHEDFGSRPGELFAEWSPCPFAPASLGQVHRARLHTGELVAVKVQYPRIREDLETAFGDPLLQDLLCTLIRTGSHEVQDEFKSRVLEECDYRREAETQRKFGEYFRHDPAIRIPAVHERFSSDRVLTSELIEGQSFHDFARTSTQETKNWAAETLVRFQAESFFWHRSLYADMHPGNLLFPPGQMAFLDFGRVLRCGEHKFDLLGELMIDVLDDDPGHGRQTVEALGMVRDWEDFDFDAFWQLLREQHCHFWSETPFEFNSAYLARKGQLMRSFRQKHAIRLNGPTFWNFFAVSTHDAIRAELRAKANWRGLILKTIRAQPGAPDPGCQRGFAFHPPT